METITDLLFKALELPQRKVSTLAPIQPLKPIQRLGWLDSVDKIRCIDSFEHFKAGGEYPVKTFTAHVRRFGHRLNITGSMDDVLWTSNEFGVGISNNEGEDIIFMQSKFLPPNPCEITNIRPVRPNYDFKKLLEHFELPHVLNAAELHPDAYEKNLNEIERIQAWMKKSHHNRDFEFAQYQIEDLATAALRDGLLLGWDTGLGKTLGSFVWMMMKTGWGFRSGITVPKAPVLIVALGDLHEQIGDEVSRNLGISVKGVSTLNDVLRWAFPPSYTLIPNFYITTYSTLACRPEVLQFFQKTIAGAICDEATKMKGQYTNVGIATRSLVPKYRAAVTATPIKNRITDLFWLLWWVAGAKETAHVGFQFGNRPSEFKRWGDRYMVVERNLTKEKENNGRKFLRQIPEAACISEMWKITAGLIVRRRKNDTGIELVKKIPHRVLIPLGTHQQQAYRGMIDYPHIDKRGRRAIGAKLTGLRQIAACPHAEHLVVRSRYAYTPKIDACLRLINDILQRGEQALIFSTFIETNNAISSYLIDAGVPHITIDGSMSPAERGHAARRLKHGFPKIGLLSELSMAYGHSFSKINNIIRTSKDWAMDIDLQAEDRAHRFDSEKDLNVYDLLCRASVDERIDKMLSDKKQSSELVLDGEMDIPEITDEDLFDLLNQTVADFESSHELPVNEEELLETWPALRSQLMETA